MLVEQGLWSTRLLAQLGDRVTRIADLGAGSGPFGQRARRVWPWAEQLAIEIREEERTSLRRHYDNVVIADMFDTEMVRQLRRFAPRLIVSNPPYSATLAALRLALSSVAIGGHVLFFVRSTFGSAAEAWEQLRQHPPCFEFSVAGRPHMRQGRNAAGDRMGGDFVGHTWLLWERRPTSSACRRHWLPPLSSEHLAWTVPPGTERSIPKFPPHYLPQHDEHP